MGRKIKRGDEAVDVSDDYVLQKDEEEVTEDKDTTDDDAKEGDAKDDAKEGDETEEEKAFFNKVKEVVTTTVKDELKAAKTKRLVSDGKDAKVNEVVKTFSTVHKDMWDKKDTPEDKKEFENLVVIQRFVRALKENDLATIKDLSEGTDSEGGYLVPSPLAASIFDIVIAEGFARREMTTIQMTSKTLDLSTLVTKPAVNYIAEGVTITASDMVFGRETLTAVKLAGITAMSNELLEDANINLMQFQIQKFAEAFIEEEDLAFFNASSSASIDGLLEDTGVTLTTMASTNVDFADMAYGDLVDVVQAIGSRQRAGAKWCFSSYIMGLVMKLLDSQNLPIWNRPVKDGAPSTLLGYPVIENDKMPDLGDTAVSTKFLVFGNFKDYFIGDRMKVTATVLTEATVGTTNLAEKDSTGLRVIERIAGVAPTPAQYSVLRTAAS